LGRDAGINVTEVVPGIEGFFFVEFLARRVFDPFMPGVTAVIGNTI